MTEFRPMACGGNDVRGAPPEWPWKPVLPSPKTLFLHPAAELPEQWEQPRECMDQSDFSHAGRQ